MPHDRRAPKKIRLGSVYLSPIAHEALRRLIQYHGHGPSATIDLVLRNAADCIEEREKPSRDESRNSGST